MEARVSDVVGVGRMPPAAAVGVVERLRAALGAVHRGLAPPPVRVLEGVFGVLDYAALGALCRLDIPDRLDGATEIPALASRVGADPAVVERLVRYGAGRGWLRIDRRGRVRATRTTRFLRRDHPGGWRAWVDFACRPEVFAAVGQLTLAPQVPDAFAAANGRSFFEWGAAHPDGRAAFDAAMAAGGRLHGLALAGCGFDWSAVRRVCDVGGGTGELLRVLLDRHPHLRGVLLDLPAVVEPVTPHERLEVVAGDAFVAQPAGCDVYLFVNVLHDWDDARAVQLLRRVRSDGGPTARAVVVEGERRDRPVDGIALRTDLLMLALAPGGRERSTEELAHLAARAGLSLTRTIPLSSGDNAHVIG